MYYFAFFICALFWHSWFNFQSCCVSLPSSSSLSLWSPASHLSSSPADREQHRPLSPRRSPSPIPLVRFGLPHCNHGRDEDEVPLSKKGEAGPGTVAPLLVCHSCRGHNLHPGVPPQDRTPQEGRGTGRYTYYFLWSLSEIAFLSFDSCKLCENIVLKGNHAEVKKWVGWKKCVKTISVSLQRKHWSKPFSMLQTKCILNPVPLGTVKTQNHILTVLFCQLCLKFQVLRKTVWLLLINVINKNMFHWPERTLINLWPTLDSH